MVLNWGFLPVNKFFLPPTCRQVYGWFGKKSPCGRPVVCVCVRLAFFYLFFGSCFHQVLPRFPPPFVCCSSGLTTTKPRGESRGRGGFFFFFFTFFKTKRQTRKKNVLLPSEIFGSFTVSRVVVSWVLRVSSSSAPQRSIHHQVCVSSTWSLCVCVSSACVFVSASHSDSRCGVFHTTKLFDSGFPKVSEDIFQFFALLFHSQKRCGGLFFHLSKKVRLFFPKIPNGNTPKKKLLQQEEEEKTRLLFALAAIVV